MSIDWDKPFKTYDELIDLMETRNIIIRDRGYVKQCLSDISYYSLINGYKDLFKCEGEKFITPVPFDLLHLIYIIDSGLNNILFKYIIDVERSLKSKISYIISKKYGVYTDISDLSNKNQDDYLCIDNYRGTPFRNNILKQIKKEIKDKSNEPDIAHYIINHNHIPCWILINNIPFGLACKLYQTMKCDDKNYVCESMISVDLPLDLKKDLLFKSLEILREYRNKIAHGKRIFTNTINKEIPKRIVLKISKGQITNEDYLNGIGKNDLVAVILIILSLTRGIQRNLFIPELLKCIEPFKNLLFVDKTIYDILNLPPNFLDGLRKTE